MQQDLAGRHGAIVQNLRVAGGDLANVGRIVNHDALADRQAKFLCRLSEAKARGQRKCRARYNNVF